LSVIYHAGGAKEKYDVFRGLLTKSARRPNACAKHFVAGEQRRVKLVNNYERVFVS
jgi:hypothetical protein